MTNTIRTHTAYHEYPISEFRDHPLIEALPPLPENDSDIVKRLSIIPYYNEKELELESRHRSLCPSRLTHFFFPMTQHAKIYKNVCSQIFDGYRYRNPVTRDGQELLHSSIDSLNYNILNRTSKISFLTGISGIGKTSLINVIAKSFGNPVIRHSNYKGVPFTETQIVYLKEDAPPQCTPKALCVTLGELTDHLLRTDQTKRYFPQRLNRAQYLISLRKMLANYHVGILIIDQFENISTAHHSGGKEELAALISNLRDGLGVPILLVGTYKAADILNNNMTIARRFSEGGYYELEKPSSYESEDWTKFCRIVWKFQWVRKTNPFSEEIGKVLFELSQGITGIMLTIFIKAQTQAINDGTETVDAKMLRNIYKTQCQPIHMMMDALKSKTQKALVHYEDLYRTSSIPIKSEESPNRYDELINQLNKNKRLDIPTSTSQKATPIKKSPSKKMSFEELKKRVHD